MSFHMALTSLAREAGFGPHHQARASTALQPHGPSERSGAEAVPPQGEKELGLQQPWPQPTWKQTLPSSELLDSQLGTFSFPVAQALAEVT